MKASQLGTGDRFVWSRKSNQSGLGAYTSPVATILADPRLNDRGEVTFPVVYDEPTSGCGDVYDVFSLRPDDDVDPAP